MNFIRLNFKHLIDYKKIKQSDLAKDLNVSKGQINSYYQQRATPTHDFIQGFCTEFNISIDDFYNKELSKHPELLNSDYIKEPEKTELKIKGESKIFTKIKVEKNTLSIKQISDLIIKNKAFFEDSEHYNIIMNDYKKDALIEYLELKHRQSK